MTLTHISHQRVFTDADIRTSGMVANIDRAVKEAYKEAEGAGINFPPSVELVLELMEGEWGYYFADHDNRVIFWFGAHRSNHLIGNVRGVKCADHISELSPGTFSRSSFFHCVTPRICARITILVRTGLEVCTFSQ